VTTRAENIGLRRNYENEIQFQFQLEIVPTRAEGSQQIEKEGPKWGFPGFAELCQRHINSDTWLANLRHFEMKRIGVSSDE
jgi:hypothetical protein